MKIGIVGVGKWGRTLARKFIEAGAEVAAHDRAGDVVMPDRFGPRVSWTKMLDDKEIDAIVAATPPDVTKNIFYNCQNARKPCLLTKPLLIDPNSNIKTTTYVDYVHLYSPLWTELMDKLTGSEIQTMNAISTGTSPARPFPASLDYGPHALSLILDAAWQQFNDVEIKNVSSILTRHRNGDENLWAEVMLNNKIRATLSCGNIGTRTTTFFAELKKGDVIYAENDGRANLSIDGKIVVRDDKHDPLARLIESFLLDVALGNVDDKLVRFSEIISTTIEDARSKNLGKI